MSKSLFISFLLLFFSSNIFALSIKEIESAIKKSGASWQAGKSWIWDAPLIDKKNIMGSAEVNTGEFLFLSNGEFDKNLNNSLPQVHSWTDYNGINYMSPVTNQGKCGSCVAFASVATLEGQLNVTNNWPDLNIDLAEQHIWACGSGSCNSGWTLNSAARLLQNKGVADEACFPYKSGAAGNDLSCSEACSDSSERSIKIKSYRPISGWSLNTREIMEALQQGPIMGRMTVYADFPAYRSGIYQHVTGSSIGGHAITIVGYNNIEKYWHVKNSWGSAWGDNGYFKIKMDDDSGLGIGSYQFIVEPFGGAAKIISPAYREIMTKDYQVTLASSFKNTTGMKLQISGNGISKTIPAVKNGDQYQLTIKTLDMEDGIYHAKAISIVDNNGQLEEKKSQTKRLFIINNKPTIEVVLNNLNDGDVVSDRIYIDLTIRSFPIPLEKLVFKIKNKDGNIREVTTSNIDEETLLGWRTFYSENGEHEIWAEGHIGNNVQESRHVKVIINNPTTK